MGKIKVAIITKNLEINGITSVILNYCDNIENKKIDTTILAGKEINKEYLERCKKNNIKIEELPKKGFKFYGCLYKKIKREKYDIVHIHGSSATIAIETMISFFCGIKTRIAHSHNTTGDHLIIHYLLKPFLNIFSTEKIACGHDAGEWMFGKKKFRIINNGINIEKFRFNYNIYKKMKKKYRLENYFVIGNIGKFNNQKNQKYLIKIFEKLAQENDNVVLMLVGTGPNYNNIKEYTNNSEFKDRIILTGELTDTVDSYNMFDLFVLPSLFEGLPVVLIEAQANGLDCIVSSSVTKEANVTNKIKYIDLNNEEEWYDIIKDKINEFDVNKRKEYTQYNIDKLIEAGFDIKSNAKILEKIYMNEK